MIVALVFLCAAASIGGLFFNYRYQDGLNKVAAELSPVIFLAGSIAVFFRPRLGYWLGLTGALVSLPWLLRSEMLLAPWKRGSGYWHSPSSPFRSPAPF